MSTPVTGFFCQRFICEIHPCCEQLQFILYYNSFILMLVAIWVVSSDRNTRTMTRSAVNIIEYVDLLSHGVAFVQNQQQLTESFTKQLSQFTLQTAVCECSKCSRPDVNTRYVNPFNFSHSGRKLKISHCGFNFCISLMMLSTFEYIYLLLLYNFCVFLVYKSISYSNRIKICSFKMFCFLFIFSI